MSPPCLLVSLKLRFKAPQVTLLQTARCFNFIPSLYFQIPRPRKVGKPAKHKKPTGPAHSPSNPICTQPQIYIRTHPLLLIFAQARTQTPSGACSSTSPPGPTTASPSSPADENARSTDSYTAQNWNAPSEKPSTKAATSHAESVRFLFMVVPIKCRISI